MKFSGTHQQLGLQPQKSVSDTDQWGQDAQSTLQPPKANPIAINQEPPVPNKGTPIVVTKNADGTTKTAHGTVAGTTVTVNLPG